MQLLWQLLVYDWQNMLAVLLHDQFPGWQIPFCAKTWGKLKLQALKNRKPPCIIQAWEMQEPESPHLKLLRLSVFNTQSFLLLECRYNSPLQNKQPAPPRGGKKKWPQDWQCWAVWQVLYAFWVCALSSCLQRPRSKPPDSISGCCPNVGEDLEPGSSYTLLWCLNAVVLVMGLKGAQPNFMNDFRFFPACSLISSTGEKIRAMELFGILWCLHSVITMLITPR